MCGRLRVGKSFVDLMHCWSELPFVRPSSGAASKARARSALAQVGCPGPWTDWHGCVTGLLLSPTSSRGYSACFRYLCRQRASIWLASCHHGPGNPRHLVGECDGRDLYRSTLHQPHQPWMPGVAELLGAPDHGERSHDEQLSPVVVAGLTDAAQPVLAAGGVLLGHEPDPGAEIAA